MRRTLVDEEAQEERYIKGLVDTRIKFSMTYRDVENSIKTFSGKDAYPTDRDIDSWIWRRNGSFSMDRTKGGICKKIVNWTKRGCSLKVKCD